MDVTTLQKNLEANGFSFRCFDTGSQAAAYLADQIHGKTVGMGGSMTLENLDLYPLLSADNQVFWHWKQPGPDTLAHAASAQVYLTSANAIAETGEILNIDGNGNRISATLYGPEIVYLLVGENKISPTFEEALWRARNVAAPLNARRMGAKTPCATGKKLKCYNCKSPDRICRGLSVLWKKTKGVGQCQVILIRKALGY